MGHKKDIVDLINNIEIAQCSSRDLDAKIAVLLDIRPLEYTGIDGFLFYKKSGDYHGPLLKFSRIDTCPPSEFYVNFRDFTGNLEFALDTLRPDDMWRVGHDCDGPNPSDFMAQIISPSNMMRMDRGIAKTPALAMCAASLRSRL